METKTNTFLDFAKEKLDQAHNLNLDLFTSEFSNQKIFLCLIKSNSDYFKLEPFLNVCFNFYNKAYFGKNLAQECLEILNKKAHDYSEINNRYSVFEFTANYVKSLGYTDKPDPNIVFAVQLGIKISRLRELLTSGKEPKNESVIDSLIDLINYRLLWEGYKMGLQ